MRSRPGATRMLAVATLWLAFSAVALELLGVDRPLPIALAILSRGDLIVLDTDDGPLRLSPGANRVSRLASVPGAITYADLVVGEVGGRESIFTTLSRSVSNLTRNQLRWLDGSGKTVKTWDLLGPGHFTGLALDSKRQQIYVANSDTGEIFRIELNAPRATPGRFVSIRNAEGLGAMVIDERRNRLLVGDSFRGTIHAVDLKTRQIELFGKNLGEPSAFAIDPASDRLFVADAAGGRIWVRSLEAASSPFQVFVKKGLDDPAGLAVARDGTVWVGDQDGGALMSFSKTGTRLQVLKPSF